MTNNNEHLRLIKSAYLTALQLPPEIRLQIQDVLCSLRDTIAKETGVDPETVQDAFEDCANLGIRP